MANVLVADVELVAEKVLSWVTTADKAVTTASPQAVAGLAALLGAVSTAVTNVGSAAGASGLNIVLDAAVAPSFVAVWTDVKAFASELGITL